MRQFSRISLRSTINGKVLKKIIDSSLWGVYTLCCFPVQIARLYMEPFDITGWKYFTWSQNLLVSTHSCSDLHITPPLTQASSSSPLVPPSPNLYPIPRNCITSLAVTTSLRQVLQQKPTKYKYNNDFPDLFSLRRKIRTVSITECILPHYINWSTKGTKRQSVAVNISRAVNQTFFYEGFAV